LCVRCGLVGEVDIAEGFMFGDRGSQSWEAQEGGLREDMSLGETTEWTRGRMDRGSSKAEGGDMERGRGWRAAKDAGEKADWSLGEKSAE
jgi:hypothetical protein